MEYKDHSYNQLDEGIISGAGALVKKMNNPALIKKAGDAITRGAEKVTPEFIKKASDRAGDATGKLAKKTLAEPAAAAGRAAANVSRKTGVRLGSEKAALGNVIKRGLASRELGKKVQDYTGGGKGLVNRVQDAVFGKDRMGGQTKMYNKGSGSDGAMHSARASRFGASVPKDVEYLKAKRKGKASMKGPNSNQEIRNVRAERIKQARETARDTASAAGTAASSSSTGSPTTPKAPSGVSTASSEPRDPADRTRNPEGQQGKPKGSILGRVAGAIGKGMRHDVNSPGRRAKAVGAVAGSINRGIGGASPGRMSGVFDNDPFTAKMRKSGDKAAFADQAQMRRQARELMQLDPSLSYGQALTAVMQQVSMSNPARSESDSD